jgi:hypothetical protein
MECVTGVVCQVRQVGELVLGQGFRGKEIQGARPGIFEHPGDDRQVIGQGFAAGGSGGEQDIFTCAHVRPGFGLMGVQGVDAGADQAAGERLGQVVREWPRLRGPRGQGLPGNEVAGQILVGLPARQERINRHVALTCLTQTQASSRSMILRNYPRRTRSARWKKQGTRHSRQSGE